VQAEVQKAEVQKASQVSVAEIPLD